MALYTAQYNYRGTDRIDITVKAAHVLSPTWDIVMPFKDEVKYNRDLAVGNYLSQYTPLLYGRLSDLHYQEELKILFHRATRGDVTLVCYCNVAKGDFCHRTYAAQFLNDLYSLEYRGERGF